MRISELAKAADVGVETVRYYQRIGLVDVPLCSGATHQYCGGDVHRLRFIKQVQALGFALSEVEELLKLPTLDRADAERLAKKHLELVQTKMLDLEQLQKLLENVLNSGT
jgi:MerR family mercuric resistance operon transcriptional regulator